MKTTYLSREDFDREIEYKLVFYLLNHISFYLGRERAIKKDDLARQLNISTRDLRDIKRDVVIKYKIPIGSTRDGYFIAVKKDEIELFIKYYKSLITKHAEIIRSYKDIIKNINQLKLKLKEDKCRSKKI